MKTTVGVVHRLSFGLSRELWLVQFGMFLNMFGYGAVLPFEVIYLHNGRGFSLNVAGLIVGTITGVAVVTVPFAGPLIDRVGARTTTIVGGVALAAGYIGLAFAYAPAQAFAAAAFAGVGNGILSNATHTTSLSAAAPDAPATASKPPTPSRPSPSPRHAVATNRPSSPAASPQPSPPESPSAGSSTTATAARTPRQAPPSQPQPAAANQPPSTCPAP